MYKLLKQFLYSNVFYLVINEGMYMQVASILEMNT